MIFAKNTANNAGVAIYGDYLDFEHLHEALHHIVKGEDEADRYFSSSIRVLSLCYDIRHALMGDRSYEFVDNGLDNDKKRRMGLVAPDKNMYLKIQVLWPEMLFLMIALNDLLKLHAEEEVKATYSPNLYAEAKVVWNRTIHQVRMLQAAITECLRETITPHAFSRLLNNMNRRHNDRSCYVIQYIDLLNDRFLKMDSDKRRTNISVFAKRIVEQDREYQDLSDLLREEANELDCNINKLRLSIEYPETIDW